METSLTNGLWLEDRRLLLAWGMSFEMLRDKTRPDFWNAPTKRNPKSILIWKTRIFCGHVGQVATEFGEAYDRQGLTFLIFHPYYLTVERWQEILECMLGRPMQVHDREEDTLDCVWHVGLISIRHYYFNGFGGDHVIFLSKRHEHA